MIEVDCISVEIYNEETYLINSVDNIRNYNRHSFGKNCDMKNFFTFIGVRCTVTGMNNLLMSKGFGTIHNQYSYMLKNDDLFVMCRR